MIEVPRRDDGAGPTPTVFFLHGAYHSPWQWRGVVDDLVLLRDIECVLVPLPGSPWAPQRDSLDAHLYAIAREMERRSGSGHIHLVGHSLGAVLACALAPHFARERRVSLFLSALPISVPRAAIRARERLGRWAASAVRPLGQRTMPLILRGRVLSDPSHAGLLRLIETPENLLTSLEGLGARGRVRVGCGALDPISGPLRAQRRLASRLDAAGVPASFRTLGLTSHYPVFFRRRYVQWLLEGLAEDLASATSDAAATVISNKL